jgi:hypothetical protein
MIIRHVDPATRIACLAVSRVFRDFASEIYCMSDDLSLVTQAAPLQPECYHRQVGNLGPFEYSKSLVFTKELHWHPVIGLRNGSSSSPSNWSLHWPSVPFDPLQNDAAGVTSDTEALSQPQFLSSEIVDDEYEKAFYGRYELQGHSSETKYNYSVMERLLPTQDIVATSGDVMGFDYTVFFCPALLFGSVPNLLRHHWRSKPLEQIGAIPSNTCIYVGARSCPENGISALSYGLAWAKQPVEDTAEGWTKTIEEAIDFATEELTRYQHSAWVQGQDIK